MRKRSIIDKDSYKILKQKGAYQPDHELPPGIQAKIDNNLLKLAGEVIVRQTKDRDGEPGGIQCIDTINEKLGMHLPAHL